MTQKGKPKSRSGCPECKSRRIKCDETKPECLICVKRNRRCSGYSRPLKWSTKYETNLNQQVRGLSDLPGLSTATYAILGELHTYPPLTNTLPSPKSTSPDVTSDSPWPIPSKSTSSPDQPVATSFGFVGDVVVSDAALEAGELQAEYSDADMWIGSLWEGDFQLQPSPPELTPDGDVEEIDSGRAPLPHADLRTIRTKIAPSKTCDIPKEAISALAQKYPSVMVRSPTHLATFLIEYWFEHVSPIWNGFDSSLNMNRKFASENVTGSEALFYSLQTMAAAYLTDKIPCLKETTLEAGRLAVQAIRRDLAKVKQASLLHCVPKDLLLSMFCMGTSGCWTDAQQLGLPFLREIKSILLYFTQNASSLSVSDRRALIHFNNSCFWWDTLYCVASDETASSAPLWMAFQEQGMSRTGIRNVSISWHHLVEGIGDLFLPDWALEFDDFFHPWTGVSATGLILFADAIAVCRRFRARMKILSLPSSSSLRAALQDIQVAENLEGRLRCLQMPKVEELPDTGDKLTPAWHLVDVGEAYRLAALLQLWQTFPELLNAQPGSKNTDIVPEIRKTALSIIKILERFPLSSGTQCLQPLLYLLASTGLKFDVALHKWEPDKLKARVAEIFSPNLDETLVDVSTDFDATATAACAKQLTEASIEVGHARQFVLERLASLQRRLPAKPITTVRKLIKETWAAYDCEGPLSHKTHWIDVMNETGLFSMFG